MRQVAASNLRFGDGVSREVGMDLKNMKATKVRVHQTRKEYRLFTRWARLESSQTPTLQSSNP